MYQLGISLENRPNGAGWAGLGEPLPDSVDPVGGGLVSGSRPRPFPSPGPPLSCHRPMFQEFSAERGNRVIRSQRRSDQATRKRLAHGEDCAPPRGRLRPGPRAGSSFLYLSGVLMRMPYVAHSRRPAIGAARARRCVAAAALPAVVWITMSGGPAQAGIAGHD